MLAVLIKIKFHLLSSPRIIQHEHQDYLYVHLVIKHYFQATENPHGVIIHVGIFRITIQQPSYELPAQYILVLLSLEFSILFQFASL